MSKVKLDMAYRTIKKLERKLSDAREAIIQSPNAPTLSPDGSEVTISRDAYNDIVKAINP